MNKRMEFFLSFGIIVQGLAVAQNTANDSLAPLFWTGLITGVISVLSSIIISSINSHHRIKEVKKTLDLQKKSSDEGKSREVLENFILNTEKIARSLSNFIVLSEDIHRAYLQLRMDNSIGTEIITKAEKIMEVMNDCVNYQNKHAEYEGYRLEAVRRKIASNNPPDPFFIDTDSIDTVEVLFNNHLESLEPDPPEDYLENYLEPLPENKMQELTDSVNDLVRFIRVSSN